MKRQPFLLASTVGVLAATAAIAQPPPSPSKSGVASGRTTKMVCRSQGETGSRLSRQRVCVTQAERDEERRVNRLDVEKAQTNRIWPGG